MDFDIFHPEYESGKNRTRVTLNPVPAKVAAGVRENAGPN